MREESVIAKCNTETGHGQQSRRKREVKPIKTERPQVQRHCGQGENKSADQERTGRPVDPVGRDSKKQGKGEKSLVQPGAVSALDVIEVGDREPRLLLSTCERHRNGRR